MLKARVVEYEPTPPGEYDATFTSIEVRDKDGSEYWHWVFTSVIDGEPTEIHDNSSALLSTRSKAFGWVKAILGAKPEDEFDFSVIVGRPCRLIVEEHPETEDRTVIARVLPPSEPSPIPDAVRASAPDEAPF